MTKILLYNTEMLSLTAVHHAERERLTAHIAQNIGWSCLAK